MDESGTTRLSDIELVHLERLATSFVKLGPIEFISRSPPLLLGELQKFDVDQYNINPDGKLYR
ncbi:MAG: hypothetical protein ACI915_005496, partial [Gammaproteobacteria bacterium]